MFLTVEAWTFLHLGAQQQMPERQRHSRIAGRSCSLSRSGSGIFSAPVSSASSSICPIVSYYEIGTQLTANHATLR